MPHISNFTPVIDVDVDADVAQFFISLESLIQSAGIINLKTTSKASTLI